MSTNVCEGRVCLVTGAGRGLGRSYAIALAEAGAEAVIVNDLGADPDGTGAELGPALSVAAEIEARGCPSLADGSDISSWGAAHDMVERAVAAFGRLDVLVNNAGTFRRGPFVDLKESQCDTVFLTNCKGTIAPAHAAAQHWQSRHNREGRLDSRLINVTSSAGLYAAPTMAAYGASKSAMATLTQVLADELDAYGVTVNGVAPGAWTRMTIPMRAAGIDLSHVATRGGFDPEGVAPLVVWLASSDSRDVTGQIFEANAGMLAVAEGWRQGPKVDQTPAHPIEVGRTVRQLLTRSVPRTSRAQNWSSRTDQT
ncbi:putative short-chain dehydrogenase/reductase [Mycobacterium saskatchewanense]|uniref:Ketoreductase domain-containing protein n=1 Tax=Mycobacterium saskatchewanense TaxID=220927 RepID=A0AAJ3NTA4_9MYCO|nr:SDR family NAD(P)-dependent oxidoreductase [Mycobacterium saskatchewanense]ORW72892.1 hypothetical protein AWC23_08525 [Mycobacterium saskatchewanense]BBX62583.1 putative short-chain dehydrogenase/reductase [Mycobacterium saskatchewanense]